MSTSTMAPRSGNATRRHENAGISCGVRNNTRSTSERSVASSGSSERIARKLMYQRPSMKRPSGGTTRRNRSTDSGVSGPVKFSNTGLKITHSPSGGRCDGLSMPGSRSSAAAVIGRDCSRQISPPAIAHSTSCGPPNKRSQSSASAATRLQSSSVSVARRRHVRGTASRRLCVRLLVSPIRTCLSPMWRSVTASPSRATR